ncbi:MAG: hypothetical protein J7K65_09055 [Planctomycetes bacterium]|nr:hypothetical protein [Planctomycetota bacterium]
MNHDILLNANPGVCWEDFPLIRSGVKVRAYTSYNPTGRTVWDFMNYTVRDDAGYELARDADSGRWTDGTTAFRAKINLANDGVRLRKRINQLAYHQAVEVYVDDECVGTWFERGSQYQLFEEKDPVPDYETDWNKIDKRFRDTEFEIPAQFTRGKSTVELKFVTKGSRSVIDRKDEGLTNEYLYWVYCYPLRSSSDSRYDPGTFNDFRRGDGISARP